MSFFLRFSDSITFLPSPILDNTESLDIDLVHRRSMTGVNYTYVKKRSSDRRRFSYTFEAVGRGKLVEVQEFFKQFGGKVIHITDHLGATNSVVFEDDEIAFTTDGRGNPSGASGARQEVGNFTLNFIEV